MSLTTLFAAFTMGLLGSLHCAGMCGPIMLILPFQFLKGWKKWLGIGLYHFGRISVYALMGLLLHSFKSFFHPQWQQYVSIVLGGVLLLLGIGSFYSDRLQIHLPWLGFVKTRSAQFIGRPGLLPLTISGVLNGLLPCGLVYMALAVSANATTVPMAMGSMYAFGIGTLPMLIAIIVLKRHIPILQMQRIKRAVPVLMLAFGVLFVLRGMNLGVPYLSPKVTVGAAGVTSSCCHSPK